MQPIVNGLEARYSQKAAFQKINASTAEGAEIFKAYALLGHPAYLILNEKGKILWQSVGEQPEAVLEAALGTYLN